MSQPGPLGPHSRWPTTLKHFHFFIQSLPHPAAVYWSDQLIFLCNDAWRRHSRDGVREGMPERSRMGNEARALIQGAMKEKQSAQIDPKLISNNFSDHNDALATHIPELDSDAVNGVLVQVFPNVGKDKERHQSLTEHHARTNSTPAPDQQDPDKDQCDPGEETEKRPPSNKNRRDRTDQSDDEAKSPTESDRLDSSSVGHGLDSIPLDENTFFKRFAAMLPTGLAILNQDAEAIFVNPQFHDLTVHEDKDKSFKAWPHTIHHDDYERVMNAYRDAFERQQPLRIEFRAQGRGDEWRLLLLSPLKEDTLRQSSLRKYGGFICAIIDISTNKAAEIAEREAAREAQERKERQERFIDMISHEIRNPLSAVLHCAENVLEIATSPELNLDDNFKNELVEAAETVQLCVAHQRSIVDEVLSFSKLDASLLTLSPKAVQPKEQFINTLKMFQPEMRKRSIEFEFKIDHSYEDFHVGWVNADVVRMAQVLVNLVTNAIKFTAKKNSSKSITVAIGASIERPTSYPPNVVFFSTDDKSFQTDGTNTEEWGSGETVHIMVAVIDTGIGISDEMQKKLFQRFHQAIPRTEQSYGGSGLGLNISRKLCHLHGGEIGVSSREGEGSTFGFFFKVRRTELQGDENRPSDQETLASAELEYQLHRLDQLPENAAHVNKGNASPSWCNTKAEHVHEVSASGSKDSQWEHTNRLAADALSEDAHNKAATKQPKHGSGPQQEDDEKMRLLLVEDNFINARILRRKLESKGIAVRTAANGREAVDAITAATPPDYAFDVVLMDQEMPVMNGSVASKEIRKWEKQTMEQHKVDHWHVPILGVSANVREAQKDSMLSAGMDDVIGKPYNFSDLIGRIKSLTEDMGGGEQSQAKS